MIQWLGGKVLAGKSELVRKLIMGMGVLTNSGEIGAAAPTLDGIGGGSGG